MFLDKENYVPYHKLHIMNYLWILYDFSFVYRNLHIDCQGNNLLYTQSKIYQEIALNF